MGGDEAFSAFVEARWPRLVRAAVLLGCSTAEAEDVAQTTLLRCLTHWRRVERADDRDAYVHRVLVNTFTSSRRRRWTGELATADVPERTTPDATDSVDTADAVLRGLGPLTEDQRTAVVLRYYVHLTEEQMATALGVARGTVKSRLSRALAALVTDPSLAELGGTR
jgi:RNA polymerase sigma-70 factor (sigma-E family)